VRRNRLLWFDRLRRWFRLVCLYPVKSKSSTHIHIFSSTVSNQYYSQCLPGTAATTKAPVTTTKAATTAAGTTTAKPAAGTGLNAKFVARGKKFWGVAADPGTLGITASANIVKAEFGAVTPENSMKWDATECKSITMINTCCA
jgi:hypothetical protein